jgi:hypothetical protein
MTRLDSLACVITRLKSSIAGYLKAPPETMPGITLERLLRLLVSKIALFETMAAHEHVYAVALQLARARIYVCFPSNSLWRPGGGEAQLLDAKGYSRDHIIISP